MPRAKSARAAAPRVSKSRKCPSKPVARDVWRRTRLLVEVLLQAMEEEIRHPESERSEQWAKLFGTRDSAVVNLQKLVQLLAALQAQCPANDEDETMVEPVSAEEIALLGEWLREFNAANVSPVAP